MNDDIYKRVFSNNLKHYMAKRGKTQADIIVDLGVNKSSISTWVNGSRLPRMDKVDLLARYLGCSRSDLIEDHSLTSPSSPADPDVKELSSMYARLDATDRTVIKSTAATLLSADKYKKGTELRNA